MSREVLNQVGRRGGEVEGGGGRRMATRQCCMRKGRGELGKRRWGKERGEPPSSGSASGRFVLRQGRVSTRKSTEKREVRTRPYQSLQLVRLDPNELVDAFVPARAYEISRKSSLKVRDTHPQAFKHSLPSSIALPVTHKNSSPPSSCIVPTGICIISSSVRVPYGSCEEID